MIKSHATLRHGFFSCFSLCLLLQETLGACASVRKGLELFTC